MMLAFPLGNLPCTGPLAYFKNQTMGTGIKGKQTLDDTSYSTGIPPWTVSSKKPRKRDPHARDHVLLIRTRKNHLPSSAEPGHTHRLHSNAWSAEFGQASNSPSLETQKQIAQLALLFEFVLSALCGTWARMWRHHGRVMPRHLRRLPKTRSEFVRRHWKQGEMDTV